MEQVGRLVSSQIAHLTVNFRTTDNDERILYALKSFQNVSQQKCDNVEINHKIYNENGAPFIYLHTNLSERPIKLLIDTGASITILAEDIVPKNISRVDYVVNLYGIIGKDVSVKTEGIVIGILEMGKQLISTTMHLVNRKFAGAADGYLGYDFLSSYGVIVDMKEMNVRFKLDNIVQTGGKEIVQNEKDKSNVETDKTEDETKNENFLNILAHTYEFPDDIIIKNKKMNRKNENVYEEYYKTVKIYEKEFEKINSFKVNSGIAKSGEHQTKVSTYFPNYDMRKNLSNAPGTKNNRSEEIYRDLRISNCSKEERATIRNVCYQFPLQFYKDGDFLSSTDVVKHKIVLIPNSRIVNVRQYRIPQTNRKILEEIVLDHERQGIIEKCQSPYNSPCLIVNKKDEFGGKKDFRFVVDYKKLNEITETLNFPIPLIDDILNGLNGCNYFTTLDIKGAFHQILMEEDSRDYTAFSMGQFKYRWIRMPFGLTSAPFTW